MKGWRRLVACSASALLLLLSGDLAAQQVDALPDPVSQLLEEDPQPLASKVTVAGKLLGNGAFRLDFEYFPGRGVRDRLGDGGIEALTFLVYSQPSRSLLALVRFGADEGAQALAADLNALSTSVIPWSEPLRAVSYLPHPPESDKTISVDLVALGRRAQVLGADEARLFDFSVSSLFRELSLVESGEALEEPQG